MIRTNEQTDINFTFSLPDQPLENSQVKPLRDTLKKALRRARPDMRFMEDGLRETQERTTGWFEFISNGIDGKLYNIMYLTPVSGRLMQGLFNCPVKDAQNWKMVILQVMDTIEEGGR